MSTLKYQPFYRRRLPHVQPSGATLFVTFRLAGSLPDETIRRLIATARRTDAALSGISDFQERTVQAYLEQRKLFGQWDTALDLAHDGPLWLRDSRIASLLVESLHYRDGLVYDLDTHCVMLNHVHAMYTPLPKEGGGYHAMPAIMRLTRTGMIEVLASDYIRTAKAKGLRPGSVLFKHALRNAIIPVVSLGAVQLGFMLGGSIIIETIFSLNGLGNLAWQSIQRSDFDVMQALVLTMSLFYILLTYFADLLNAYLDPRIRVS